MRLRRTFLILSIVLASCATARAQIKIGALPSGTPVTTDIVPYVADPAGSAATKKTTVSDLFGALTPFQLQSSNRHGDGTSKFQLFTGSSSANDCAKFDASGNLVTNGGTCAAAAPVQSVFGRTGTVTAQTNDYNFNQVAGTVSTSQQPSSTVNSVVNDTNITGSISAQALTLGWTGTLGKSRQHAATLYNDQANTYSTGAQDFGSASSLKVPTSAGASPSAAGQFAYDSTANVYKGHNGTAGKTFAFTDSNITGNASTATQLAANGSNCSAGNAAAGVDASGAVEGCAALPANTTSTANQFFTAYNSTTGAFTKAQPGFADLSGTASTSQVADNAITYAKMQDVSAASKLLGRGSSGSGDPQEITLGSNFSMSGTTLSVTVGGVGGWTDGTTRTVAAASTQYMYLLGPGTTFNGTESNRQNVIPDGFTISRLYIRTSATQPNDGALTCTVRDNAADTSVVVTITANAAAGTFSDTSNSASLAAGHLTSLKCVNASASTSAGIFDVRLVMVRN